MAFDNIPPFVSAFSPISSDELQTQVALPDTISHIAMMKRGEQTLPLVQNKLAMTFNMPVLGSLLSSPLMQRTV